jgi:hypothetical protein
VKIERLFTRAGEGPYKNIIGDSYSAVFPKPNSRRYSGMPKALDAMRPLRRNYRMHLTLRRTV